MAENKAELHGSLPLSEFSDQTEGGFKTHTHTHQKLGLGRLFPSCLLVPMYLSARLKRGWGTSTQSPRASVLPLWPSGHSTGSVGRVCAREGR